MASNVTLTLTAHSIPEAIWFSNAIIFLLIFLFGVFGYYGFNKSILGALILQGVLMIISLVFYPIIVGIFSV